MKTNEKRVISLFIAVNGLYLGVVGISDKVSLNLNEWIGYNLLAIGFISFMYFIWSVSEDAF